MEPSIYIIFGVIVLLAVIALIGCCIYEIRNALERRRDRNLTRKLISG